MSRCREQKIQISCAPFYLEAVEELLRETGVGVTLPLYPALTDLQVSRDMATVTEMQGRHGS